MGRLIFTATLRQPGAHGTSPGQIPVDVPAESATAALLDCERRYKGHTVERLDLDGAVVWTPEGGFWTGAGWQAEEDPALTRQGIADGAIAADPEPVEEKGLLQQANELDRPRGDTLAAEYIDPADGAGAGPRFVDLDAKSVASAQEEFSRLHPDCKLLHLYARVWRSPDLLSP